MAASMRVTQHLWFEKDMEAALQLYTSLIPGSAIHATYTLPEVPPPEGCPPGTCTVAEFSLGDQRYMAIEAGPLDPFNHSFSVMVEVDTQEEIDRLWEKLGEGGAYEPCGWLKDRWGLSWQICPKKFGEWMTHPDVEVRRRALAAAMQMPGKLNLAELEAAVNASASA